MVGFIFLNLKKSNSIIILENKILFKKPSNFSKPILRLEKGRIINYQKVFKIPGAMLKLKIIMDG